MTHKAVVPALAALAVAIHVLETAVPSPIPFLRPGLANVISLIGILFLGIREGLAITWIRVIVGSLFSGGFLGPGFLLSLSGGTASTLAMGLCVPFRGTYVSLVGICLVGATVHLLTQFGVAYLLFLGNGVFLHLVPLLLLCALLSGLFTGVVSHLLVEKLGKTELFHLRQPPELAGRV